MMGSPAGGLSRATHRCASFGRGRAALRRLAATAAAVLLENVDPGAAVGSGGQGRLPGVLGPGAGGRVGSSGASSSVCGRGSCGGGALARRRGAAIGIAPFDCGRRPRRSERRARGPGPFARPLRAAPRFGAAPRLRSRFRGAAPAIEGRRARVRCPGTDATVRVRTTRARRLRTTPHETAPEQPRSSRHPGRRRNGMEGSSHPIGRRAGHRTHVLLETRGTRARVDSRSGVARGSSGGGRAGRGHQGA